MPDFAALFMVYLFVTLCCIGVAWGIKEIAFGLGRVVGDWWTMRRVRKQARDELSEAKR